MNQQELEALLAQIAPNGQTARLEFTEETKVRKVKRKVPAASEFGSPTEEEIEVRVPTRTWIDRATGRTVTVEVNEDGSYNKIFDGIEPKNQGAAATKPDDDKPNVTTQQITRNGRTYTVQTTTPKEGGAPTIKVYGPDGKEVPGGLPDESKQPKETKTVVKGADGKQYIRVTVEKPDGTSEVYHTDQNGTRVTLPDDESNGFPGEPAGAPPLNMTPGQVADGLRQYSSYLSQQVKLWKDTGGKRGIAPEQATKLMDQRIKVAEAAGREADNLAARQQGIYGTQITQRGQTLSETASRRGDANSAYSNNLARFLPQMSMMGAGGGQLVANALDASLNANRAYVDQWGGFRESPEIQVPGFLQQIRDASMAGIQTAANGGPVLVGNTGMGAPAAAPPPPAQAASASAALAAAEAARQQASANGGASEPAPPPPAAVNPVSQNPITVQGPSALPAPTPVPDAGAPYNPPMVQPSASGAVAPPESPTFLPPAPVDMPGNPGAGYNPSNASQGGPIDPYTGLPRTSMAPSFLSQARYGQPYDPRARGLALGIRPDILELALAG